MFDFGKYKFQIAAAAVVIIIMWLAIMVYQIAQFEDYLFGQWYASADAFTDKANLSGVTMLIGKVNTKETAKARKTVRGCYIVMTAKADGEIANTTFSMTYKAPLYIIPFTKSYKFAAELKFDKPVNMIPNKLTVEIFPQTGLLKMYKVENKEDVLYMRLYKNHMGTEVAEAEAKKPAT
jgi:hypothetical protein